MTPLGQKVAAARQSYEDSISVMNETLLEINEATGGVGLPRPLHHPFRSTHFVSVTSNDEVKTEFLSYGDWRDIWQLCYCIRYGESGDIEFQKPLLDCTLDVRFQALKSLPEFVEELFLLFESQSGEIRSSIVAASKVVHLG